MRIQLTALLSCALLLAQAVVTAAEPDDVAGMMRLTDTTTARVSSFDRSGGNTDYVSLAPGETRELAALEGSGVVRHLYFSILGGPHYLRDLVLRAYWDGADTPCVEVPFGDLFGLGQERPRFFTSSMVAVNPGDLGVFGTYGFNSYFPMPYARGARITLTNDGPEPVAAVWYHIEYERVKSLPRDFGRFHASWHRVSPTHASGDEPNVTLHAARNVTGADNYVVLEARGHGRLAGIFLNIDNAWDTWYGEGDDMIFIDGEAWPPSYHGTGSEEIFGGGACPTAEYAGPYTGFHLIGNLDYRGKVSMYRFYVHDPVRFSKSIRMTVEHGHANNFANDYSSTALWYQDEPHAAFAPLPPAAERHPRDGADPHDVAWQRLAALRPRVLALWLGSIRNRTRLPDDVSHALKHDLSAAYFGRDYAGVMQQLDAIEPRIEALLKSMSPR